MTRMLVGWQRNVRINSCTLCVDLLAMKVLASQFHSFHSFAATSARPNKRYAIFISVSVRDANKIIELVSHFFLVCSSLNHELTINTERGEEIGNEAGNRKKEAERER